MKKIGIVAAVLLMCFLTGCAAQLNMKDGVAALEEGKLDEAIQLFELALENDTEEAGNAYLGIGMAYFEKEEYELAKNALNTALEQGAEKTPEIYHLLGICDMKLENFQSALTSFEMGLQLIGETDTKYAAVAQEMRYNEIVCYEELKEWKRASEKAEAYIKLYPEDQDAQKEAQFLRTR